MEFVELTEIEKKIIFYIQGDIAITQRPFQDIANKLDITEEELLKYLNSLCERQVIRRFGATIRHQQSGFEANAMIAWQVDESQIDLVGKKMSLFKEVSHCYRRDPTANWNYNIYTMIHAKNEKACLEIACKIAHETNLEKYTILFSVKELKKTSMQYFA